MKKDSKEKSENIKITRKKFISYRYIYQTFAMEKW
jgi:hypothetical protein